MMKALSFPLPLAWLHVLIACSFSEPCLCNNNGMTRKKNYFCKECLCAMCYYCSFQHIMHSILRIHRYLYRDVVYVFQVQAYVNVMDIQTNKLYNGEVIQIKEQGSPISHPGGRFKLPDGITPCAVCSHGIKMEYRFCSIECKLKQWHHDKQENPASNVVSWSFPAVEPVPSRGLKVIIKNHYGKKQGESSSVALPSSQAGENMASSQTTVPSHLEPLKRCPHHGTNCPKLKGIPPPSPNDDIN